MGSLLNQFNSPTKSEVFRAERIYFFFNFKLSLLESSILFKVNRESWVKTFTGYMLNYLLSNLDLKLNKNSQTCIKRYFSICSIMIGTITENSQKTFLFTGQL